MRELTIDIDDRIVYTDCKTGDQSGRVSCDIENKFGSFSSSVGWDSINRTEAEALQLLKEFIIKHS